MPEPVAGVPPVAVQVIVNGEVPPVTVAVQAMGVPTVPVVGQLIASARFTTDEIVIDAEFVAVFALASVMVTLIVSEPVAEKVVEKVAEVAVALGAALTDHAYVYGPVPPVADAVNVTEVPDFAVLGPLTVTASASGETVTVTDAVAVFAFPSVAVTEIV